jgi:predicted nucleic acid-binding protein
VIIVVDTSILIDHLRGDTRAHSLLAGALESEHRLVGSVMTKVEVLAGMRPGEESSTNRLLALFTWAAVDEAIANRAGERARQYLRSHPGVDPIDFVIAATVELLGAEFWTTNLKHYPMFSGLKDPYPTRSGT